MKYILNFTIVTIITSLFFVACKKVENRSILSDNIGAPVWSAAPSSLILDSSNFESTADSITYSWAPSEYGFDAAVRYTVQLKKAADSWTNLSVKNYVVDPKATSKSFTYANLNNIVMAMGGVAGEAFPMTVRIMSELVNTKSVKPVYSTDKSLSITPYQSPAPPVYPKLYIPGDYQGWAPSDVSCAYIESVTMDSKFEGYFEQTKADGTSGSGEFKMTPAPNWDYDFGDNGTNYTDPIMGSGVIGPKSAGTNGTNFKLANGTYYVTVDTASLAWTYELRNWALTGSATSLGWPAGPDGTAGQDLNMRYNSASKMYEITTDLITGEVKFRMNDAWSTNYGDDGADGSLEAGGANIAIATDGNYTIKFDLENKTYTITKN